MAARPLLVADLFCGAGGTSTGVVRAVENRKDLQRRLKMVAVNHWPLAIETHSANHPQAVHWCESLDSLPPVKAIPEDWPRINGRPYLDILVASPECIHHSAARGGKPVEDQSRASAWHVVRWAEHLRPHSILVENVKEFLDWGPVGRNGRPIKSQKGQTFRAWVAALESLGYRVEWRKLVAADYGDPTTRERLFIQARLKSRKIRWPERTHVPRHEAAQADMFSQMKTWRPVREVLNLEKKGKSIFSRKKPLARTTMNRIAAGIRKLVTPELQEPFLVVLRNHMNASSINDPLPTVTASGNHFGVATPQLTPFMVQVGGPTGKGRNPKDVEEPMETILTENHTALVQPQLEPFLIGQQSGSVPRSINDPAPTISTKGAISVVEPKMEPFVVTVAHGDEGPKSRGRRVHDVNDPLPTVTANGIQHAVATPVLEPFLVPFRGERDGQKPRTHDIDEPMPTVTTIHGHALVEPRLEPFVVQFAHKDGTDGRVSSVDEPLRTVTTKAEFAVAEPVLVQVNHSSCENHHTRVRSTDEPMPTVTGKNGFGVAQFVIKYYSTGGAYSIDEPLDTITTKARFALVEINGNLYKLDILFRMLEHKELSGAQGFPKDYQFKGKVTQIVKQIGNAVPVHLATALAECLID